MKKKPARPRLTIKKTASGFRFHFQLEYAETLNQMLSETVLAEPFTSMNTMQRCMVACIAEIVLKLSARLVMPKQEFELTLSHAQACALHHVLSTQPFTETAMETLVQSLIISDLDKMVA